MCCPIRYSTKKIKMVFLFCFVFGLHYLCKGNHKPRTMEQQKPKRIPYGMQNWEDLRLENCYYVDKTRFIAEIEAANRFFFFIRPRRFGKSLLMNMLRQYYDVRKASLFERLFGDLWIGQHPTEAHNTYLVLYLNFAAFSGHKLYAPMGIGGLYGRKELLKSMPPFLSGGDMISYVHEDRAAWAEAPRKFEAGTRNVGGEVGLAAAMDYMESIGWEAITAHEEALMEQTLDGLKKLPFITVYGGGTAKERKGVISFNVQDVHPHDVATILDAEGVAVRAGHHCAQPLMEYLGIGACARASFAVYNTQEDVEIFLNALKSVRRWMGLES